MAYPELPRWPLNFDDPAEAKRAFEWLNDNRRQRGLPLLDRSLIDDRTGRNPVAGPFAEYAADVPEDAPTDPAEESTESHVIYEKGGADEVVSDTTPEPLRAGDQVAERVLKKGTIEFHAKFKNDKGVPGSPQEHARHGPGGSYHLHLKQQGKKKRGRASRLRTGSP